MPETENQTTNRLLAAFPSALRDELEPHLEPVMLDARDAIATPGEPYDFVCFPRSRFRVPRFGRRSPWCCP